MSRPEQPSAWRKGAVNVLDHVLLGAADEDFPALSGTISEINRIVASESESAHKPTQAILQDFALTDKLLRLVNTASYGQLARQGELAPVFRVPSAASSAANFCWLSQAA